eukprot:scaffold30614_cov32-Tisochrysis_lutea.AAC.3
MSETSRTCEGSGCVISTFFAMSSSSPGTHRSSYTNSPGGVQWLLRRCGAPNSTRHPCRTSADPPGGRAWPSSPVPFADPFDPPRPPSAILTRPRSSQRSACTRLSRCLLMERLLSFRTAAT